MSLLSLMFLPPPSPFSLLPDTMPVRQQWLWEGSLGKYFHQEFCSRNEPGTPPPPPPGSPGSPGSPRTCYCASPFRPGSQDQAALSTREGLGLPPCGAHSLVRPRVWPRLGAHPCWSWWAGPPAGDAPRAGLPSARGAPVSGCSPCGVAVLRG